MESKKSVCDLYAICTSVYKYMKREIFLNFLILVIIVGVIAVINYTIAWTEPTSTPPLNNVPAPINVGSTAQVKSGGLGINGANPGTGYGFAIDKSASNNVAAAKISDETAKINVYFASLYSALSKNGIDVYNDVDGARGIFVKSNGAGNTYGIQVQNLSTSSGSYGLTSYSPNIAGSFFGGFYALDAQASGSTNVNAKAIHSLYYNGVSSNEVALSTKDYAGQFYGNVAVVGNLTVSGTCTGCGGSGGGTADNWGTQVVQTDTTLTGNGTAGSKLGLASQSASSGQVLKWNGSAWVPQNDNTGSGGTTLPNGAMEGDVLRWNATSNSWEIGGGTKGIVITNTAGSAKAIYSKATGLGGYGVYGEVDATSGFSGVAGVTSGTGTTAFGVYGGSQSGTAVKGYTLRGIGVLGWAQDIGGIGVKGYTANTTGFGVYGEALYSSTAWAGYFKGKVEVTGATKTASLEVTGTTKTTNLTATGTCIDTTAPTSAACNINDLAESMQAANDVEAGDIVATDSEMKLIKATKDSNTTIGVISTNPTMKLESEINVDGQPIALAGIVYVKVNNENGAIKAGDFITASSTPGFGMKAVESATVIGKALEDLNNESGQIRIFVGLSYYNAANCNK